jgi:hypothetical protein
MIRQEVRTAEKEIDLFIANLPVWNTKRQVLLTKLMTIWRDGLELLGLTTAHALTFNIPNGVEKGIAQEHQLATGVYQCLKWAMMFSSVDGLESIDDRALTEIVMKTAAHYQIFVDALKMGNHDKVSFAVGEENKTLTVYEGGDLTGFDSEILRRNHLTTPFRSQGPLVADDDQLTSYWNAGQYREYWRWLKELCAGAEKETIMAQAGPLAPMQDVMKRPVVIEIPTPLAHLDGVQRDLTLTVAKVQSQLNWKIDGWHDCPLIEIGDRIFAVTLALKTIEESDDYMLRVAVLNDPVQYEKVSGLREDRMIAVCKAAFEKEGWTFKARHLVSNPAREIDGYATRAAEVLIVQLKSTLRPQSPWEVLKRNADVLEGIRHTAEIVERIGSPAMGVVITDGYAGDYATWQESIRAGVPVATLDDAALIAADPTAAFSAFAVRAGLDKTQAAADANERKISLGAWTIRLIDEPPPK